MDAKKRHSLIEWHLRNWAESQKFYAINLGYKTSRVFRISGSKSFDDMCRDFDKLTADIFDVIVSELPQISQDAINHQYLGTLWKHSRKVDVERKKAYPLIWEKMEKKNLI